MNEKKKQLTLCVFIDAFGWELVQQHAFLDDILIHKAPLQTIFGYSSTCDPTILTGAMPHEHGHFAFFIYDPDHSPFKGYRIFTLLPKFLMERGRVRGKFSQIMKKWHGFTGYFQLYNMPFRYLHLFNYTEQDNIFSPGGINGGQPTIFDFIRDNDIPYCRPEGYDEPTNVAEVEQAIADYAPPFVYLFLGNMDGTLHAHGTQSQETKDHIAWYDQRLRQLYAKASEAYDEVHLYCFSDHGMTDITETCDLMGRIDALGLRFGVDYAAAFDSTMGRFWFLKDGVEEKVVAALEAEPRGHIMSKDELAAYGCNFQGNTYGDLFFLLDPGVLLCPSHMGVKPLAGMHGYAPQDKDSVAAFMTNQPMESLPGGLQDLYGLMRSELAAWAKER